MPETEAGLVKKIPTSSGMALSISTLITAKIKWLLQTEHLQASTLFSPATL